jgi:hypothetical protein
VKGQEKGAEEEEEGAACVRVLEGLRDVFFPLADTAPPPFTAFLHFSGDAEVRSLRLLSGDSAFWDERNEGKGIAKSGAQKGVRRDEDRGGRGGLRQGRCWDCCACIVYR